MLFHILVVVINSVSWERFTQLTAHFLCYANCISTCLLSSQPTFYVMQIVLVLVYSAHSPLSMLCKLYIIVLDTIVVGAVLG